jgi:hypothetical protein
VPSLEDHDFTAADYEVRALRVLLVCVVSRNHQPVFFSPQKIAIAAEVEENTLANVTPLSRKALLDLLA